MSDLFLSTKNTSEVQKEGLGSEAYVWGQGSNDFVLGVNKDFKTVEGITKLQQDINKVILTDRFKHTLYPIYGSTIRDIVGSKIDLTIVKTNIKNAVVEALAVLQFLNNDNPNADEQINVINSINVEIGEDSEILVSVQITTKSGKTINTVLAV